MVSSCDCDNKLIVGKDNGHHNGMYTYLSVTETYIGPGGANIYWPEVRAAL